MIAYLLLLWIRMRNRVGLAVLGTDLLGAKPDHGTVQFMGFALPTNI